MKRDQHEALVKWKTSNGRKPLILKGARQVGKTHLLESFGREEFSKTIYLNFERDARLAGFFSSTLDPQEILYNLRNHTHQDIQPDKTLIIFDEIQECPSALNSLKYFCEEAPQYHICAAGSLLGVKLSTERGFPVGKVNFLELHPMSFGEFLDAIGKDQYRRILSDIQIAAPIPLPFHEELVELMRLYLFIGGMPEAILKYTTTRDLLNVRNIHHEILNAYELDFAKHAPKHLIAKISEVWQSIPAQLARENKKFIFSAIRKSARGRDYEEAIGWLNDVGLILRSFNLSAPRLPLRGYENREAFKVFLLDVGLLSTMSAIPTQAALQSHQLFTEFKGALTENYVAQSFTQQGISLHYWTSNGHAEIDFIIEYEGHVYPVEVKSGTSTKQKSLRVYKDAYAPDKLLRVSLLNLKQDHNLINIPIYLLSKITHPFPNLTHDTTRRDLSTKWRG